MIGGSTPLFEDLNVPLNLLRDSKEDIEEILACHIS
jgi:hypothetical protein